LPAELIFPQDSGSATMIASNTKRPRNVDAPRAAAILYGDWGTSKAYVVGLAFAVAGYSSFWLIAAMCLLTALVGVNYMAICKHYPDGGGVYASVRHRSEIISIVGAFLLVADYIVTAALSALSAFQYLGQYLGIPHPEICAAVSIAVIGGLNVFGPKHTGGLAFLVSLPTVIVVVLLGMFCLPHLGQAVHNVQPLTGGFLKNWNGFVGVVLALSGVEAIANATGVMKLNPGTTDANPNVSKTSTKAIVWVMLEVCLFTALLGLAMHALPNLVPTPDGDVNATATATVPASNGVRDYMLGYMAQVFVGGSFGHVAGHIAALIVSLVFAGLLLSAVNTAIVDLIAISFLMSRDGELPSRFQKLNRFGVPNLSIIIATVIPAVLVIAVKDMASLADLYAVGVVGAIATNLGASSTDKKLGLVRWERWLMFCTFLVMLAIEISLFADKPSARFFAGSVLVIGLVLRGLANEQTRRKVMVTATFMVIGVSFALIWYEFNARILAVSLLAMGLVLWLLVGEVSRKKSRANGAPVSPPTAAAQAAASAASALPMDMDSATGLPMMCAIRGVGKTLDFAIEEAKDSRRPLYLLFVRSLPALTAEDFKRKWPEDAEASEIFTQAKNKAGSHPVFPCYAVSDSVADTIVDIAATMGVSYLVLGAPERRGLASLLQGNVVRYISDNLPEDVHLLVYA
jgi:amino acid transporter/nucleotide-binding universal stress UspA family protein